MKRLITRLASTTAVLITIASTANAWQWTNWTPTKYLSQSNCISRVGKFLGRQSELRGVWENVSAVSAVTRDAEPTLFVVVCSPDGRSVMFYEDRSKNVNEGWELMNDLKNRFEREEGP